VKTRLEDKLMAMAQAKQKTAPCSKGVLEQERAISVSHFPDVHDNIACALSSMGNNDFTAIGPSARILFMDTETTGLSTGAGTVAFLVGIGYINNGMLTVRQYFMRDYNDEPELLNRLKCILPHFDILVTFNGATYDLPLLKTRFLMNRMDPEPFMMPHADLLHMARRVFKLRLRNCPLSRLEEWVLGVHRTQDIPGMLVPERYFSYLKSGDLSLLDDVFIHNQQDIVALYGLMSTLIQMYEHPQTVTHHQDIYSIGLALEKKKQYERARACFSLALNGDCAYQSLNRLAHNYRKTGEYCKAAEVFKRMTQHHNSGVEPYIELAKLYEHRFKDDDKALEYALQAARILNGDGLGDALPVQAAQNALQCRCDRLLRRVKSGEEQQHGVHGKHQGA